MENVQPCLSKYRALQISAPDEIQLHIANTTTRGIAQIPSCLNLLVKF